MDPSKLAVLVGRVIFFADGRMMAVGGRLSVVVVVAMDLRLLSEAGPTSTQRSGNSNRRM